MSSSVFCFSWNTSGVKFCETTSAFEAQKNRSGYRQFIKGNCSVAEFIGPVVEKLRAFSPAIVVFSTQGGAVTGSYLHSDILINTLGDVGYGLYAGKDSSVKYQGIKSTIRVSVFIRNDLTELYADGKSKIIRVHHNAQLTVECTNNSSYAKAIATYIKHPTYGSTAIIACHVFHGQNNTRDLANISADLCVGTILDKAVDSTPSPTRFIIMGDLGYSIDDPQESDSLSALIKKDNLSGKLGKGVFIGVSEGVKKAGIKFAPTWNLGTSSRLKCLDGTAYSSSCYNGISWRDRILYGEKQPSGQYLMCASYESFDHPSMSQSSHASIIATFDLKAKK